jgi:hypothetical protein
MRVTLLSGVEKGGGGRTVQSFARSTGKFIRMKGTKSYDKNMNNACEDIQTTDEPFLTFHILQLVFLLDFLFLGLFAQKSRNVFMPKSGMNVGNFE